MNEQEQTDLEALKTEVKKREQSCYYYMKSILSYDETARLRSGFRTSGRVWTIAEALEHIIKDNEKRISELYKDYLKKYPDEK